MSRISNIPNEQLAAKAFSAQSLVFDSVYGPDTMINYKRLRVRSHTEKYLSPDASILELNAGTGEDALYFARKGYRVHATDIAEGMIQALAKKASATTGISFEQCSYLSLSSLNNKGPYDHIFSNFAGLNCTGELNKVLNSFSPLLAPGGHVTLVLLPRFCLWETLLIARGKFRTAFRRFFAGKGRGAVVEGSAFSCWYYNPSYVTRHLAGSFEVVSIEGLCTIVPPSYIDGFADKYPRLFQKLRQWEEKLSKSWPWKLIGDYYIITLQKSRPVSNPSK